MGPGRTRLLMQLPVDLGDMLRIENSALLLELVALGKILTNEAGVDGAIDNRMRHMNALGAELSRHRLRQRAQAVLGTGKGRKARAPAHAGCGTGKDNGAATAWQHDLGGFAP